MNSVSFPANGPVLCIPRVFANINESRIRRVFNELDMGTLKRVDIVQKVSSTGEKFNRVFVHYEKWNNTPNSIAARERLLNGKEIKVIYDDPWFWKISAYREPDAKMTAVAAPQPNYHRKATIQFDDEDNRRPPAVDNRRYEDNRRPAVDNRRYEDNRRPAAVNRHHENNRQQQQHYENNRRYEDNRRPPAADNSNLNFVPRQLTIPKIPKMVRSQATGFPDVYPDMVQPNTPRPPKEETVVTPVHEDTHSHNLSPVSHQSNDTASDAESASESATASDYQYSVPQEIELTGIDYGPLMKIPRIKRNAKKNNA
jgi:hypothetical protein